MNKKINIVIKCYLKSIMYSNYNIILYLEKWSSPTPISDYIAVPAWQSKQTFV